MIWFFHDAPPFVHRNMEEITGVPKRHMKRLDDVDRKILSILEDNGREKIVKISERIGLSQTACVERIKGLERLGVIKKYTIDLDRNLLDCAFVVFVQVMFTESSNENFNRFVKAVEKIVEIEECHMVSGDFDCLLKVRQKDMKEFRTVITQKLSDIPGIARTNSYVVIDELKSNSKVMAAGQ